MSDTDRTSKLPSTIPPEPQTDEEAAFEGAIAVIHEELGSVRELATSVVTKLDGIRLAVAAIANAQQRLNERQGRAEGRLSALESHAKKLQEEVDELRRTILPPAAPEQAGG